jgi:hypothetical protein
MSVCPSAYKEQLGCHWVDIHEILLLCIFRKTVEQIQVSLKSDNNNGYFACRHFFTIFCSVLLRMRNVSDKSYGENHNTHFSSIYVYIFFFENPTAYGILWKNIVNPNRPRMIVWCMRVACWIPQATNTVSEYIIIIAFPLNSGCTYAP